MKNENNNKTYIGKITKQPIPAFTLENKYFDHLRHPRDISIYAQLARLNYEDAFLHPEFMLQFCQKMGITNDELYDTYLLLEQLGLLAIGK